MAPMAEARRNRSNRPPKANAPLTGAINVDDETAAALALFNARLVKQAEGERAAKRVERAARAKDAAAAKVRELETDTKATAEQRAEAATEYRQAVDALDRAKKGDPEPSAEVDATSSEGPTESADATPAETADDGAGESAGDDAGDTAGDPVVQTEDVKGDDATEATAASDQ